MESTAAEMFFQPGSPQSNKKRVLISSDVLAPFLPPIIPGGRASSGERRRADRRSLAENRIRNARGACPCQMRADTAVSFPSPEHVVTKQSNPGLVE